MKEFISPMQLVRVPALLCFCIIMFMQPFHTRAQSIITGKYVENSGTAIPFATVLLLNSEDSTLVKGEVTDNSGAFSIKTSLEGKFLISVRTLGYEDYFSQEISLNNTQRTLELGNLSGVARDQELDAVVVVAQKPLFEQRIDRTIVNVGSSITSSGGSVLDILARSPGVTVDRMNNSVALAGKQGIRIMINGKISQIPLEATIQMLEGMTAETVETIELITTPPAQYEAEGDGGLINIVLKQQTDLGTNGNFSLFTGYGRGEKYGANINFNKRTKNLNVYGDYSYNSDATRQDLRFDRIVSIEGIPFAFSTENIRNATIGVHSGRLGADWNIGKKTTIGGLVSVFDRSWENFAFADILQPVNGKPNGRVEMPYQNYDDWTLWVGNVNISHIFNDRHRLSMDVDRIHFTQFNPADYKQRFFEPGHVFVNEIDLFSRKNTPIDTWVGKLDYVLTREKFSLETGAKASFSALKNDISVESVEEGITTIDTELSSQATMKENIGAVYTSVNINASKKIALKMGLRYEHTLTDINTLEEGNVIDRNFGNFFPSIFFQNTINPNNSYVFSYSRRITRPSFSQLAPFVLFVDPNSFLSGNVNLLPSMTDALKAEYRYKSVLFSLQYSHDKNSISIFQPKVSDNGRIINTAENIDLRNNYSANIAVPFNITDWWSWQVNMSANVFRVKADFLSEPVDITISNFSLNGSQKFTLPNQFTAEISGTYQSKQLFGIMEVRAVGGLDFGLEKKIQDSRLRLSFTDMFDSNKRYLSTSIPEENLNTRWVLDFETRIVRITYSSSFGNRKMKINRRNATGSDEEQKRFQ